MTHTKRDDFERLTAKTPAAQYLRMSTEHQQYSPDNQAAAIQRYADEKGFDIVSTYSDEGRSGVSVGGRSGLLQLIEDVESGRSHFAAILVTMSVAGADFKIPTKRPSTKFDAAGQALRCIIVQSHSTMTAVSCRRS